MTSKLFFVVDIIGMSSTVLKRFSGFDPTMMVISIAAKIPQPGHQKEI
ncbi:hypothetical protein X733_29075 [Mesorhizobium sp. L2C067A000]|nr:hypothetical protein X733_29075 [Mesorhizobium sp. L2C067A000]